MAAQRHPERMALVGADATLTYAELSRRAVEAAIALQGLGVRSGERVALALQDRVEFAVALHACLLLRTPVVPIDLRLAEPEQTLRARGTAVVVREPLHASSGSLAPGKTIDRDAVAAVMHTSGTTSAPKPVELTFGNWMSNALGSAVALGLDLHERWLCPMPLVHVGGLSILIRSAIYATTVVAPERYDTASVLAELMDRERRITLVSLVPTMLARLLDAGLREPPTLRWALLGGGPIAPSLLERAAAAGVPVASTYGMTEACSQIATHGWPLPGVEVALDPDGEILVRGDIVAPGALAAGGWLYTGDLGSFDERGRLQIIGRKTDTIVTGGENVAPSEVEAALLEHPAVADAGVYARADPEWGEAIVAAVVARVPGSLSDGELRAHCAQRLAPFKVPKAFRFVECLPRTASGKLLRRELGAV